MGRGVVSVWMRNTVVYYCTMQTYPYRSAYRGDRDEAADRSAHSATGGHHYRANRYYVYRQRPGVQHNRSEVLRSM